MDPIIIAAFARSLDNVFTTMLQTKVRISLPVLDQSEAARFNVSGLIGLTGEVTGVVVLGYPTATAASLIERFVGEALDIHSEDFADAIGEVSNMVAGGAKASFAQRRAMLSCPTVVVNDGHEVLRPTGTPTVRFPCASEMGPFVLDVAIRDQVAAQARATSASDQAVGLKETDR